MCYPAPGPYCSAYAQTIYNQAKSECKPDSKDRYLARYEWYSTPEGIAYLSGLRDVSSAEESKDWQSVIDHLTQIREEQIKRYTVLMRHNSLTTLGLETTSDLEITQVVKQLSRFESGKQLLSEEVDEYARYHGHALRTIRKLRLEAQQLAQKISVSLMEMSDLDPNTDDYAGMRESVVPVYENFIRTKGGLLSKTHLAQLDTWRELAQIDECIIPSFEFDRHFRPIDRVAIQRQVQELGYASLRRAMS